MIYLIRREDAIKAITEAYEDIDAEYILKKIPTVNYSVLVFEPLPDFEEQEDREDG